MAATVITGKKVGTYSDAQGRNFYLLFEETHCIKDGPKYKHWGAFAFGEIETVLSRIFDFAEITVGGMLQGSSGAIKPENFVNSWLKELKSPTVMRLDVGATLKLKDIDSLFSGETIAAEKRESFLSEMDKTGYAQKANELRDSGMTKADFYLDADLIALFCQYASPWKIMNLGNLEGTVLVDGGYAPEKSKLAPPVDLPGRFMSTDHYGNKAYIGKGETGELTFIGDHFSVLAKFVKDYKPYELSHPGHFKASTQALRDHLETISENASGLMVYFDPAKVKARYWKSQVEEASKAVGDGIRLDQVPTEQIYNLSHLFPEAVTFKEIEQSITTRQQEQPMLELA